MGVESGVNCVNRVRGKAVMRVESGVNCVYWVRGKAIMGVCSVHSTYRVSSQAVMYMVECLVGLGLRVQLWTTGGQAGHGEE